MRRSHDSALRPDVGPSSGSGAPLQETVSPGTPPAVDEGQLLLRGKTFPKARRDEELELPGMLDRCVKLITGVKKLVAEMRETVKNVVSHREKCAMLLSAAMAASVALDQALYTGNLGLANEKELQMLCTEVSSALALGETRIRVYGLQPRWKKYLKQLGGRRTERKFDEVVQQLAQLTQRAWTLQEGPNANSNSRFDLARVSRTPRSRRTFSGSFSSPKQMMPESPCLQQGDANPQVLLSRTRLRRGGQRNCVLSLLYIPPERSTGPAAALGQVWWYVGGCLPQLAVHNLAKNETIAVKTNQNMPGILVMAQDITGNVWTAHKDGYVRVWSEGSHHPVCAPFRAMHSDVTCITMDDSGLVWLGSSSGDVKAVALAVLKQPHGGLSKRIEVRTTLRWGGPGSAAASAQDTPAARSPSIASLASSWSPSGQRAASVTPDSERAHGGPVLAIAAQGGRLWTSGRGKDAATLREWSSQGRPSSSVTLGDLGAANAIMTMPRYVNVVRQDEGEAAESEQAGAGSCGAAGPSPASSAEAEQACGCVSVVTKQLSGKGSDNLWQLMTAHECGRCQLWDISSGQLQPVALLGSPTHPAKALLLCEEIGLWGTAHTDGSIILRLLPTGDADERHTLTVDPNGPVPALNIPHFRAPFCAHRGGLAHAVGSGASVVTAGVYGSIVFWPEAELRSVAEAVGFVLPNRRAAQQGEGRRVSISQVLQRYFTPHSAAMAEYALASAVINRVKSHRAGTAEGSRLSPVQSIGDREGEEAQIIIEEVANLLRSSTSSGNGPTAATRATSLASDLTTSLQSTQGPASTPAAPASSHANEVSFSAFTEELPHANTEPDPHAVGEAIRADPMTEASYDIRHSPSTPNLAEESGYGQELQGSLKSSSLSAVNFSPNWIIPYHELTLKKKIGEGSIGRVHLGRWQETDVAIKVLNSLSSIGVAAADPSDPGFSQQQQVARQSAIADDSSRLQTLEREVNIMAALRHPNVVLFMGVCLEPPCVVSEWCARGSLFDVLMKARSTPALGPQLDWARRLNMALDAAKGMLQLHTRQIIHRDLKSPNLLVDKHWRVKVCDFNLSRVETSAQDKSSSISANNPRWLAPEVISNRAFSKAADVFSFGVILWELATWQLPWEELSIFQIMVSVAEKGLRPDIPEQPQGGAFQGWPAYVDLIERCWAEDPAQRPTFEGAITDLRELLTETATLSRQRRLEAPSNDASNPPTPRHNSGMLEGAQPQPVPGARQVSLGQVPGLAPAKRDGDGRSSASPSGFTVPLHGSEDGSNVSTHRSSLRLSSVSDRDRRSTESADGGGGGTGPSDPLRRALQQAVALNAANAHTVNLLSPGGDGSEPSGSDETRAGAAAGPGGEHVNRMTGGAASQGAAAQQGGDGGLAAGAEDPPTDPPTVAGGGPIASPFGVPAQQAVPQGPESVEEVRERIESATSTGRSSSLGGPKLSKVDEVQSSMERSSSDLAVDSQGRQGKSSVLEGIHEQERSQQNSSSSTSWSRSGTRSGSQATTRTSSCESAPGSASPTVEPLPSTPGIHPDFLGAAATSGGASREGGAGIPATEQAAAGTAGPSTTVRSGAESRAGRSPGGDAGAPQQLTPFETASRAAGESVGSEAASQASTGGAEGGFASGSSGEQRSERASGGLGKLWASGKRALGMR
ncbi:probable serine/threonine-protein kinase CTR1 at C-terminar half [Coccomyxa sp. Obi]|nr:probable serine/threonine-protein kinase CTR1 at C-terminar half [Coccomyxa sp. Obi]